MSLLLKNCLVSDPQSSYHSKKSNLFIESGIIQKVGSNVNAKKTIDLDGLMVTPGWVDMNANFGEPGLEHKEDIASGSKAAAYSGFTDVCLWPNNDPVTETNGDVEFLRSKKSSSVDLHIVGAVSRGLKGEEMTEMLDLHEAGVCAFSDGYNSIENKELLLKSLQYVQKFDGLLISRPTDSNLSRNAQMHEGVVSTRLGLRGEPSVSEKMQISAQLDILRYVGGRLHFALISTAEGLELIKSAKKEGLNVTCDVGINHLLLTDSDLVSFDSRFKIDPPFRTENDRKALIKGVNDGTVDAIVSAHMPQDQESKMLEFDLAEFGCTSIQTTYSVLRKLDKEIKLDRVIECLTSGPRRILKMEEVSIKEGSKAKLAVLDPDYEWTLDKKTNLSKSENSPFWGKLLRGKSRGTINGTKVSLDL